MKTDAVRSIFSLQRVRKLNKPLPPFVHKANEPHWKIIKERYASIAQDLQGINAYRYRSITGGNQEFIEAASFQHYLESQQLLTYEDAKKQVTALGGENTPVSLPVGDYVLGLYDMTGELMKFSITTMAMEGKVPTGLEAVDGEDVRTVLSDLREIRGLLEGIDIPRTMDLGRDVGKKMGVMQASVEKVEKSLYGLTVRGAERPKGWVPELSETGPREEIESY